ncbi:MAG: polysaccharide deacetylase family protein [Thermodesulfobacteriota bacterium]
MSPEIFDRHMRFLYRKGYSFLSEQDLVTFLFGDVPLPGRSVMVTFDDGYLDNYTNALPILERYGARATIFLSVRMIGETLLWDERSTSFLSLFQIKEIRRRGIDFGSHGMTHRSLTKCPDKQVKEEIRLSKKALEDLLGQEVGLFSYPFGHYDRAVKETVRLSGFKCAFTLHKGINRKGTDPYALRRLKPGGTLAGLLLLILSAPVIECLRSLSRSRHV